jgi:hypothetical protein
LCHAVENLCELQQATTLSPRPSTRQARSSGTRRPWSAAFPRAINFAAMRESSVTSAAELIRRAKATGTLRRDIRVDDLTLMIMANSGIHASTPKARIAASRRFAALMIQAVRTL